MICPYIKDCIIAEISERDCPYDFETCQTYKFYKRYPEQLGCGAMMISPGDLEKEINNDRRAV